MEVLKAYSHTPDQLYDLRKTREVVCGEASNEPDDVQPPQLRPWSMADRLPPEDIQTMIEKYHAAPSPRTWPSSTASASKVFGGCYASMVHGYATDKTR